jgi:YebC/PmpR family DNA-binding regulatory protein
LEFAIAKARAQNMPKDNIERAIKRGTGESKEGGELEQVFYEGFANHGVALMIEVVTDNRNRAVAEIRHTLTRNGGNMAEAGAVGWQFNRCAYFSFPAEGVDQNKVFELAVEAGADDVIFDKNTIEIIGPVESFKAISDSLTSIEIQPEEAGLRLIPKNEIELEPDATVQVMRTIEVLEELDDVQEVFSNLTITDEAMAKLEEA